VGATGGWLANLQQGEFQTLPYAIGSHNFASSNDPDELQKARMKMEDLIILDWSNVENTIHYFVDNVS
jgi:hypothetical protein